MQPISYMVRRLQVLKPANDPFKLNPQVKYNGKRVEIGTDWDAKNAEIQAKRDAQRQAYDRVHGAGAYDAKVHAKIVELKKIFKTLTNK
ncbi:ADP-ribosylglycohydrolase [Lactobacillus phage CV244]|nr:ADP-ribosylglycohydrolase [Lactobacillus phage CV244]